MKLSHISWNIVGLVLPLVVAAIAVPELIDRIGQERFGLLALAWGLVSYAGALDLGIGRALTQMVSRLQGTQQTEQIPDALATASKITLLAGFLGCVAIVFFTLIVGTSWLKTTHIPAEEVRNAMLLLAIAWIIPDRSGAK